MIRIQDLVILKIRYGIIPLIFYEAENFPQTLSDYARVYTDIMEAIYATEGKSPPQETVVFEPLYPVSIKPMNRN